MIQKKTSLYPLLKALSSGRLGAYLLLMDFYKDPRWERMRLHILKRDGYQCQLSKRYGKNREAEVVHHIFPREEFPEYAFEEWNLISITRREHNSLHYRDTDELTEEGAELLRRTARKNNIEIPTKYLERLKRRDKYGRPVEKRFPK